MIDIPLIQKKVSEVTGIAIVDFNVPNHYPLARERRLIIARQVSMVMARKYTNYSLARIGMSHGGRDHATVLHAYKTVNDQIETNNSDMVNIYREVFLKCEECVEEMKKLIGSQEDLFYRKVFIKSEIDLPKENGYYFFKYGIIQGFGSGMINYIKGIDDKKWLKNIDWYLQPYKLEQLDEKPEN